MAKVTPAQAAQAIDNFKKSTNWEDGKGLGMIDVTKIPKKIGIPGRVGYSTDFEKYAAGESSEQTEQVESAPGVRYTTFKR